MTRGERALLAILAALTLLRLWWCGRFELSPDEAYYWLWSQRLDWAYYSKGPGIAVAIRATTALLGDTERGVRMLSPLLALGTTGLLWLLARDAVSRAAATATALALQCLPPFNVGALLMTIDPLSIFFWCLALLAGWRALRSGSALAWAGCGAAAGLGFLCKYTNVLALAGILLALAWAPGAARRGRSALAALAGFLPFTLPPILWNAQRDWATARHLFERGGLAREGAWLQPRETAEFLAVQLGLYALVLVMLPAIVRRARVAEGPRFLLLASAPILVLYAVLALHEAGEPNWTGPGMLGLMPIAAAAWLEKRDVPAARRFVVAALALGAVLSLVVVSASVPARLGLPPRLDPSARLQGWRETARAVRELAGTTPVMANHYGLASELAFYGAFEPTPTVPLTPRPRNQFWFWRRDDDARHASTVTFVTDRARAPDLDAEGLACVPAGERAIEGAAGTLRTIRAWTCEPLRVP